jgi:uncharacterized protein YlzI (FlbEa/FlbD family)
MKLAKIGKNTYINPERIDSIEYYPSVDVTNVVINGYSIRLEETPIKKVLDAICGSEERLVFDPKDIYLKSSQKKK